MTDPPLKDNFIYGFVTETMPQINGPICKHDMECYNNVIISIISQTHTILKYFLPYYTMLFFHIDLPTVEMFNLLQNTLSPKYC